MAEPGEQVQLLGAGKVPVKGSGLRGCDPRILFPGQNQARTINHPGIVRGIEPEGIETVLYPYPEDEEMGRREGWHTHG